MSKSLFAFLFLTLGFALSSCDDGLENPNYPVEPSITFKEIVFIETPSLGQSDTLKLIIKYKDGDSDLGLDWSNEEDSEYPYHDNYYFLADGTGDTSRVLTEVVYEADGSRAFQLLKSEFGVTGKLVTNETRLQPNYEYLPTYDPNSCTDYNQTQILVSAASGVVDETYTIIDTLQDGFGMDYFLVESSFLFHRNENHNNLFVEFFVLDNGNFLEFDWLEEYCIDFNGRFPFLGKHTGTIKTLPFKIKAKTPWEGEITYSMVSTGFLSIFSNKQMKLAIRIKDRALHSSNVVETPVFTLQ